MSAPRCPKCDRVPIDNPAPGWFYCGRCGEAFERPTDAPEPTQQDAGEGKTT